MLLEPLGRDALLDTYNQCMTDAKTGMRPPSDSGLDDRLERVFIALSTYVDDHLMTDEGLDVQTLTDFEKRCEALLARQMSRLKE